MQKVLVLVGPTAIGKTRLSLQLAPMLKAEIISGDSMQVYREVSIGTAKATISERKRVKHYLIDTRSIFEPYSVKDFVEQAKTAIQIVASSQHLPFVVGGTGFYIKALLKRMQLGEQAQFKHGVDQHWRDYLATAGPEKLWEQLAKEDPLAAKKIPVANTRRILRALTVIERTGRKFSEQQDIIKPRYDYFIIGLNTQRQRIYRRINERVEQMMKKGLLKEARFVYDHRKEEHQVLQAIGYKEFFPYFEGKASVPECVQKLKAASHHYAKRQLTYLRHQLMVHWFDPYQSEDYQTEILEAVHHWLNK